MRPPMIMPMRSLGEETVRRAAVFWKISRGSCLDSPPPPEPTAEPSHNPAFMLSEEYIADLLEKIKQTVK